MNNNKGGLQPIGAPALDMQRGAGAPVAPVLPTPMESENLSLTYKAKLA